MNRGIYIQIIENEEFQDRIFWNESSDIYMFLRNHTLKIEHKFDTKFNSFSDNEIPMDGIKMLADGINNDLNFLIGEYENKPIVNGLNSVDAEWYALYNFEKQLVYGFTALVFWRKSDGNRSVFTSRRYQSRFCFKR